MLSFIRSLEFTAARLVPGWLAGLALRFGLAVPFYFSGLTKWVAPFKLNDSAITLFEQEFKLHILGKVYDYPFPTLMAYGSGTAEIVLPVLLAAGLFSRLAAAGLLIMTGIIQLTIPDGWPIHITWAAMALGVIALGPGKVSVDGAARGLA
ncbi:MAG: DoxX family protein [Hyphomicrobiales bacterium]